MDFSGDILTVDEISLQELIDQLSGDDKSGAITTFSGIVRDISDSSEKKVVGMEVEAWSEKGKDNMTEIARRIGTEFNLLGMRLVHLTGMLKIGDPIIYVVISSIHRKEAFAALEAVIHAYKNESPVWKKELYDDGTGEWIRTQDLASDEAPN